MPYDYSYKDSTLSEEELYSKKLHRQKEKAETPCCRFHAGRHHCGRRRSIADYVEITHTLQQHCLGISSRRDAAICHDNLDLKFKNTSDVPVMIKAQYNGNLLAVQFLSSQKHAYTVERTSQIVSSVDICSV